ncbi:MAG TPA: response regulator [Blastocatellia bacterium]|nr:response regulator [Blastocatellia bacterium]
MSTPLKHILCVEDHKDTCELVSLCLEMNGYRVTAAGTMAEALRLAKSTRFDLYLLDTRLPDGTGDELCEQIREFDPDTPVVIHTGDAREETRARLLGTCAQAFVTKPSDPEVLTETVTELIEAPGA